MTHYFSWASFLMHCSGITGSYSSSKRPSWLRMGSYLSTWRLWTDVSYSLGSIWLCFLCGLRYCMSLIYFSSFHSNFACSKFTSLHFTVIYLIGVIYIGVQLCTNAEGWKEQDLPPVQSSRWGERSLCKGRLQVPRWSRRWSVWLKTSYRRLFNMLSIRWMFWFLDYLLHEDF